MYDTTALQDIYAVGHEYLCAFEDVNEAMVERHLTDWQNRRPTSLDGLYRNLLQTAQNRQGMGNAIGSVDGLEDVLYGFDPVAVESTYESWEGVFDAVESNDDVEPPGPMERDNAQNLWVQYSKSIRSGAEFLAQFEDIQEFSAFVDRFSSDVYTRYALTLLLGDRITGFGTALASDFLKESGYPEYVKPDTHIQDVMLGLELVNSTEPFELFAAMTDFATAIEVPPYEVDKLFWIIGSGRFPLDGLEINTDKQAFIEHALEAIEA